MFFVPALLIPSVMNFMQNSVYFCLYSELASVPTYIGLFRKKSKQGEDGGGGGGEGVVEGLRTCFFYKTPGDLDF